MCPAKKAVEVAFVGDLNSNVLGTYVDFVLDNAEESEVV
jgi:hypothetical protein